MNITLIEGAKPLRFFNNSLKATLIDEGVVVEVDEKQGNYLLNSYPNRLCKAGSEAKPAPKTPDAPKADNTPQETLDLRAKYEEVIGKPVASSYKNNVEWMQKKIEETLAANEE